MRLRPFLFDDLNTPLALSRLQRLHDPSVLRASAELLGLLQSGHQDWFQPRITGSINVVLNDDVLVATGTVSHTDDSIGNLIAARAEAKKNRDFATADRIRDELKAQGIVLEDGPNGTTWRRE